MQVILILKYIPVHDAWDAIKGHHKHFTWKAFWSGRLMIEGLLDWNQQELEIDLDAERTVLQ